MSTPVEMTADYAYFRLRDEGYQQADIERWAAIDRVAAGVSDAFVYFKHEEQGLGPDSRGGSSRRRGWRWVRVVKWLGVGEGCFQLPVAGF